MRASWKGTLTQYSGRLHRLHPTKTDVRIYDYGAIGYARGEAPLGFSEPIEERTVEYDQETLRNSQEDP